eukprot:scaffold9009_cov58-Phaeocystis_antarctica.AAC.1
MYAGVRQTSSRSCWPPPPQARPAARPAALRRRLTAPASRATPQWASPRWSHRGSLRWSREHRKQEHLLSRR